MLGQFLDGCVGNLSNYAQPPRLLSVRFCHLDEQVIKIEFLAASTFASAGAIPSWLGLFLPVRARVDPPDASAAEVIPHR